MRVTDSARDRLQTADRKLLLGIGTVTLVAFVLLVVLVVGKLDAAPHRSEAYKDASGAAGLEASIDYKCDSCNQKFDFYVYMLKKDGQQAGVVRPDKEGKVRMALPEGDYVMLIGKQFGKDKVFPQEAVALKNGKKLELKLHY